MEYYISKENGKIIGIEGERIVEFIKIVAGGGQDSLEVQPVKKRIWGSNRLKGKQEYGAKAESIRKLLGKDLSVKEVVQKLQDKFPTITPGDVYVERAKLKKAQPSDTFTGGKPEAQEETDEDTL